MLLVKLDYESSKLTSIILSVFLLINFFEVLESWVFNIVFISKTQMFRENDFLMKKITFFTVNAVTFVVVVPTRFGLDLALSFVRRLFHT